MADENPEIDDKRIQHTREHGFRKVDRKDVPFHGADFSIKQLSPRGSGDYRAVGRDGEELITTADVGEAIQTCIDHADTEYDSVLSIHLSGGFFYFASTANTTRSIELRGQGRNRTFLAGHADPHIKLDNAEAINEFKHLKWSGSDNRAIQITSAKEFNAAFVEWRDCKQAAIHYDMDSGQEDFWSEMTSCWVLQNGASNPTASDHGGLVYQNANGGGVQEFNITGGFFDSNHSITDDDGNSAYGPAIRVAAGSNVRNLNVRTTFKHNQPLVLSGGEQMSFTGCHFRDIQGSRAVNLNDRSAISDCGVSFTGCTFESNANSQPTQHAIIGGNWDNLTWESNHHLGPTDTAFVLAYSNDVRVRGGNIDYNAIGGTPTRLRVNGRGRNAGDPTTTGQWSGFGTTVGREGLEIEDTTNGTMYTALTDGTWTAV